MERYCDYVNLLEEHIPTPELINKHYDTIEIFKYHVLALFHPNLPLQLIKILKEADDEKFKSIIKFGLKMDIFYQVYFALGALSIDYSDNPNNKLEFLKEKAKEKNCEEIIELNNPNSIKDDLENVQITDSVWKNLFNYTKAYAVYCQVKLDINQDDVFFILHNITQNTITEEYKDENSIFLFFKKSIQLILSLGYSMDTLFEIIYYYRNYREKYSIEKIIKYLYLLKVENYSAFEFPVYLEEYVFQESFVTWTTTFFEYIKYKFPNECILYIQKYIGILNKTL